MVRIAVAGGSGELAREIIDVLKAAKKHEIIVLTRSSHVQDATSGVMSHAVNYNDKENLIQALRRVHTVLSFVGHAMPGFENSQKNLIDASIAAGVKRFAPSEYGSNDKEDLPFWAAKIATARYLEEVNRDGKVLEYTLFQPGMMMDYLATPHRTTKYITPLDTFIDFQNCRTIVVDGHEDAVICLTAVRDIAGIVARAVEYEGEWPVFGGIRGNRISIAQVLKIGEKIRGRPFAVEKVKLEDLETGNLKSSWSLERKHPIAVGAPPELVAAMLKTVLIGTLLSSAKGAWDVSDEWNKRLPDFEFTRIEIFLAGVWEGKPVIGS